MNKLKRTFILMVFITAIFFNFSMIRSINKVHASTSTPCAAGYIACLEAGGNNDECWAGFCACLEVRYGSGCDELE